jgi:hypothetical protein
MEVSYGIKAIVVVVVIVIVVVVVIVAVVVMGHIGWKQKRIANGVKSGQNWML